MLKLPPSVSCPECRHIARTLKTAWRHDTDVLRARLVDVAHASGVDVLKFDIHWVFSLATMPDADMKSLLESHYPKVTEAMQQRSAHERLSGHSVMWQGWWTSQPYGGWVEPE